jgi:signal transduction histidine kinase
MLKSLTSLLLLVLSFAGIEAQHANIDSLRQQLAHAKKDTNKVWLLVDMAGFYQWSYPDSGISYSQEALQLAQKLSFANGEIAAYGTLEEAFSGKGNYPKALEAALKGLELAQQSGDSTRIIWSYVIIGDVYYYSADYKRALYYYNKLKSNSTVFSQFRAVFSFFLGETYFHLNQPDSALYYLNISSHLDERMGNAYFFLGEIHAQKSEFSTAIELYHRGIGLSGSKLSLLEGYIGIAGIFKKMKSADSAIYYARLSLSLVPDGSFPSKIVQASEILTDIYTTVGFTDSALKYTQIMMVAKDSLFSQAKQNLAFNEQMYQQDLQQKIEQEQLTSRNRQNNIVLLSGLVIGLIVSVGLWRRNIYKQRSYSILQEQKQEIDTQKTKVEKTLEELRSTQAQLIQSEKMASLGELTAGIAHEIQNPLNFVNNFSEVNKELLAEMNEEISKKNYDEVEVIAKDIIDNEQKILHHGKRADAIVKGMLQHSRASTGEKKLTDINALADEYLRLSYHGMRAKDKSFNVTLKTNFDTSIEKINIVPQDIGRVLLNLFNNAFYALQQKQNLTGLQDLSGLKNYKPTISVCTKKIDNKIEIRVKDNGTGIPQKVVDKIFQPFFTTKPTGQGTGLGLSLSYDIIKAHGGEIKVETREGEGSEFVISLQIV